MNDLQKFISLLEDSPLFKRFLQSTPFSSRELVVLLYSAPDRYKEHTIKKRNNRGLRLISQPTSEIKFMQRLLIANELSDLPIHPCATAYIKGKSIADHARIHANNRYLLKLDFRDFFHSISEKTVLYCLSRDTNFTPVELWAIVNILCKRDRSSGNLSLSIGAPSSPHLSNYILYEFDEALNNFCNSIDVIYTRYADDLAFSSSKPKVLDLVYKFVQDFLTEHEYLNLFLNSEKTINVSKKHKRSLVGLVLSNAGSISIGREEKRKIRAMLHKYHYGNLNLADTNKLRGHLAFLLSIDKEFVTSLCEKYNIAKVADIVKFSEEEGACHKTTIGDDFPF